MTGTDQRVAVITGGSQGTGAGLVAGHRRLGWAAVTNTRAIKPSEDPDVLAVEGDISQPATADRITGDALARFGRIDTLEQPGRTGRSDRAPERRRRRFHERGIGARFARILEH